jgi:glycosyltransferase involved in cell wall biosynthesis
MNILHIGNIRNIPHNGVCVVVPMILEHQSKIASVTLLNLSSYVPENSTKKYEVLHLEKYKHTIAQELTKYDLIVFHEFYWYSYINLYKQAIKLDIPYIILPHGSITKYALGNKKFKKLIANILIFNRFANNSTAIHYLSDKEKNKSVYPKVNSFVFGNGIDLSNVRKESFSKNGIKLIYVGRIDPYIKGLDILIEAVKILKESNVGIKIRVTIAGNGTEKNISIVRNLIEKYNLNKLVILESGVFGQTKINKILENDCFIQLSRSEAQCLGLMEAMSLGIPTLATPGTTFYEVMKANNVGIAVNNNSHDVANTILDISIGKYRLEDISRNGANYIAENYSWEKISRATINKYKKVLATRKLKIPRSD